MTAPVHRLWATALALALSALPAAAAAPAWSVNPADYEAAASVTARVRVDEAAVGGTDHRLGAFVGTELRGVAAPADLGDGTWLFFLTVHDDSDGDTLHFRAYLADRDAVVDLRETLIFQANSDTAHHRPPSS